MNNTTTDQLRSPLRSVTGVSCKPRGPRHDPATPGSPRGSGELARRIGKKKAVITIAHAIVVAIWHMHTNQCHDTDLGTDWWDQRSSTATETAGLKRRLEALGHHVTLEPAA